jgi:hypothetical protein
MRPLRPFCGTVLKAQLLTLPATISTSANGVVTTQLSFLPPASSTATEMCGSLRQPSRHRAAARAAAHHHEIEGIRHAQLPRIFCSGGLPAALWGAKLRFCGVYGKCGSNGRF